MMDTGGLGGSDSDLGSQLEGDIIIPGVHRDTNHEGPGPELNTLDEPIMETITRDLKTVGNKFMEAMVPNANNALMKEWDLWGPLIMCTYIGLMLQTIGGDSSGYEFTELVILVWVGMAVLTYNLVFASTTTTAISTFQCVCVLGYCLAPLAVAITVFQIMALFGAVQGTFFLRLIISVACAGWASFGAIKIFGVSAQPDRKYVVLGPVAVFYLLVALLILFHSGPSSSSQIPDVVTTTVASSSKAAAV